MVTELMLQQGADDIADDAAIFKPEGLGLDSVDALQLVVALEKKFGLKLPDADAARNVLRDVNSITAARMCPLACSLPAAPAASRVVAGRRRLPPASMRGAMPFPPRSRTNRKMTEQMTGMLPPGSTIGILGGGQLGRMLSVAASRLGYRTHIYEPAANPPAEHVAHRLTTASYDDLASLAAFAASVDVITYEFENIPTAALDVLEKTHPIRPNRRALAVSQDRLTEKQFIEKLGGKPAPVLDGLTGEHYLQAYLARIGARPSAKA